MISQTENTVKYQKMKNQSNHNKKLSHSTKLDNFEKARAREEQQILANNIMNLQKVIRTALI
jgi:hypothetical protein